ncbi:Iron transporter FTH1 [Yarrowia sp. B02]|nr:Iron transporter FTH1 [Yarrowia sp. B02]
MVDYADFFENYFSVQVFFIIFRETIETAIIISVLLAFLNQGLGDNVTQKDLQVYRRLVTQVWLGGIFGLLICLAVGGAFIATFYIYGHDLWGMTENVWEGVFSIVSSVIITIMGAAMLRINKMREKWRHKIAKILVETHEGHGTWGLKYLSRKYALAILPFVTTLREGMEAVVFLGGIGVNQPFSAFPLPVITAVALGSAIGYAMYKYGNAISINYFLIGSTCFLYLVAAGLFSRGVWFLELQQFINKVGMDVSETGSGPGSYDITKSVWHVNCCNGQTDGGWMIANALFGWTNSATYGSVLSYNFYWIFIMVAVYVSLTKEKTGYNPLYPRSWQSKKFSRLPQNDDEDRLFQRASAVYSADMNIEGQGTNKSSQYGTNSIPNSANTEAENRESVDSDAPLLASTS